MPCHACFVVPPHLLQAIADNNSVARVGKAAANTLAVAHYVHQSRTALFEGNLARLRHIAQDQGNAAGSGGMSGQNIVPPHLLDQLSTGEGVDDTVKESARNTLFAQTGIQGGRTETKVKQPGAPTTVWRGVYDMQTNGIPDAGIPGNDSSDDQDALSLPGKEVRTEGQPPVEDQPVNEAYENAGKVTQFYREVFKYTVWDYHNKQLVSSVHVGYNWLNAAWFGNDEYQQMVYGDGDGQFLYNFTASLDVIGHEITHAVTQKNSMLQYQREPGALNEHISDTFGVMVKQYFDKTTAKDADWLIGEEVLVPSVKGVALRNMRNPGTAYDDPQYGKDPQPASVADMQKFIAQHTAFQQAPGQSNDNGGCHIFSGIPNRAFVIIAEAFDGYSWEKAGQIWWNTVTTHRIPPNCTFIQFADATVDAANELFGDQAAGVVRDAWNQVGVVRKH